jgi:hypothetical protein
MDGMGEAYRTMLRAERTNDRSYVSDFSFGEDAFQCIPSDLKDQAQISYFDWREAESVYVYERKETTMHLRPIFKRFTPENSPPWYERMNLRLKNMLFLSCIAVTSSNYISRLLLLYLATTKKERKSRF